MPQVQGCHKCKAGDAGAQEVTFHPSLFLKYVGDPRQGSGFRVQGSGLGFDLGYYPILQPRAFWYPEAIIVGRKVRAFGSRHRI